MLSIKDFGCKNEKFWDGKANDAVSFNLKF